MTDPYKRTALALYSLHAQDQHWLLEHLPAEDKEKISSLLSELEEMNIELEPTILKKINDTESTIPSKPANEDTIQKINNARAQDILSLLESEPEWLIANLMMVKRWRWSNNLFASLGKEKELRIQKLMRALEAPKPAVREALITALAKHIESQPHKNPFDELLTVNPSNTKWAKNRTVKVG